MVLHTALLRAAPLHTAHLHMISFLRPVFSSAPSSVISFKTLGSYPAALYSAMSFEGSAPMRGEKVSMRYSFRVFKPKVSRHDKLVFKYNFDKEEDQRMYILSMGREFPVPAYNLSAYVV